MTWFNSASSNATSGSNVVKIDDNQSVANIRPSDALVLGSFGPVEIAKAYATPNGVFIELIKPWPNATQSQVPCVVLPTSGDFNAAVSALNNASKIVNDNYKTMVDWQTKTGSVQFKDLDGNTHTIKTLQQLQSEIAAVNPYPWAMRKVEFEARRQQNLEKYAASGSVNMGLHIDIASNPAAGEGLWTWLSSPNLMSLGVAETDSGGQGRSKTKHSTLHISGLLFDLKQLCHINYVFIKLPPAEDGTRTYDSATGIPVTHSSPSIAFASETATNKVVTDRVDMWGFESVLREINDSDPFVYRHGLIQSRAPNINGVTTSDDNVRQIEYFAWYEGDTTSRGRGVNWQTATEAQRMAIASDPANKIYFDDATGKFYQQCVRGRSFAGLGNGDWLNSGENLNYVIGFDAHNTSRVPAHGKMDTAEKNLSASSGFFSALSNYSTNPADKGVYTSQRNISASSDELVYFLPCGTVNRLNKGAYHLSFNKFGTADFWNKDNATNGSAKWFSEHSKSVSNTAQCFDFGDFGSNSHTNANFGKMGNTHTNGRPDGRFYDVIYASGQGGVCRDMRYSAKRLSLEQFATHDLQVKSGDYRGVERLRKFAPKELHTTVYFYSAVQRNFVLYGSNILAGNELAIGDVFWVKPNGTNKFYAARITKGYASYITANLLNEQSHPIDDGAAAGSSLTAEYWMPQYINTSIAYEYVRTDVIGPPANILLCEALKNGWVGGWVPEIPNNNVKEYPFTAPVNSFLSWGSTDDNGTTWTMVSTAPSNFDAANNARTFSKTLNQIYIYNYTTKAKVTKPANSAVVHGAKHGLGDVFVSKSYKASHGALLGYSLINKVMTCAGPETHKEYALSSSALKDKKLDFAMHGPIDLTPPTNNGPAFKALIYVTKHNGQAFFNYAYTELDHNGTDWGDDGVINNVNAQSTMPDDNGNDVIFGAAQITQSLGWI